MYLMKNGGIKPKQKPLTSIFLLDVNMNKD